MNPRDIICFSSIDWDFIWQGHQEIMSRLAADGHRVLFLENDRQLGVKNGMLATVEAASSGRITVKLDRDGRGDGERIEVHAEVYRNLDHGYAATGLLRDQALRHNGPETGGETGANSLLVTLVE